MDEATLRRLEFPHIRKRLAAHCAFAPSRELAESLLPSPVRATVLRRLAELAEAARLVAGRSGAGRGLRDVRAQVARAARGGRLSGPELVEVASFIEAATGLAGLVREAGDCPLLAGVAAQVRPLPDLVDAVRVALRDDGLIRDEASPRLAALRSRARLLEQRVRERMESLLRSLERRGVLQEALITQRDGRFVLPVRADQRSQVRGIVHDQSGSGATVFVEPAPVVELNNELRQCVLDAQREEERILDELSGRVGRWSQVLEAMIAACAYLDFSLARARLAAEMDAVAPQILPEPRLRLVGARHPLLGPGAVPIDVELGFQFDVLVITGPNTGGKTVALKTIGLTTVMAQAGLYVPCREAEVGVFRRIFADIGDEQSIEQSLSTFSAHLTHILTVIPTVDRHTLILLDEIGAGTDPEEGAALAMALLDYLLEKQARVVATTHFGRLKAYAYQQPRAENASVAFDAETLQPTYRLLVGSPGRSNALQIARRLGMPEALIERAHAYLPGGAVRVEEAITGLDAARRRLEEERAALSRERLQAARLQAELEARRRDLEDRRRRFGEQVRAEVRATVNRLIGEAEEAVAALRRAARERQPAGDPAAGLQRVRDLGRTLERVLDDLEREGGGSGDDARAGSGRETTQHDATPQDAAGWRPRVGEWALIRPLRQAGRIVEEAGGNTFVLDTGRWRIRVAAADLEPAPPGAEGDPGAGPAADLAGPPPDARPTASALNKTGQVSPEISLRGMRVDEALPRLDKYLDDAVLAGLPEVRVIHGKGTGTLRSAVHELLRQDPRVESYALAGPGEGSFGVTVVRLRA
ncbi:MAG TPA: endonuclease MutS2 [Bacillota bacterium]